jgi:hypothetical protein
MNTGPADTSSTHLDLGDLIAEVNGQAIDDRAREHLARCERCRAEANRWDLVAGGVRGLMAATPEAAQPARPQHTRPRIPAGPRRRTILAAAAAALVILGAVGYGASNFVHITFGTSGTGAGTVLTAVGGCTGLEEAAGTLERMNGSSLVLKTASGQRVTVTTMPSTLMSLSGPLRSEITNGASVMVRGSRSGGTIAAAIITVGPPFRAVSPTGMVPVWGTVSGASTAGFTLITPTGTRVPVTTTGDTLVVVPHASLDQLRRGATIFAVGHAGPHGTLSAQVATQIVQFPSAGPLGLHPVLHVGVHLRNCSPGAIAAALTPDG